MVVRHRALLAERAATGEGDLVRGAQVDDGAQPTVDEPRRVVGRNGGQVVRADREALPDRAARDADAAEVAEVDGRAEREGGQHGGGVGGAVGEGHVIFLLMTALAWSMAVTSTMMQMTIADRCP